MTGSQVNLIVAALDLRLVQLIRGAMAAADAASGKGLPGALGIGPSPDRFEFSPRQHVQPEPVIEPRQRLHPTPLIEPRPVFHPTVRVESQVVAAPAEPEKPRIAPSPIQPPWKTLPWKNCPPPPIQKIKMALRPVDVGKKGSVFDVFI